MNSILIHFDAAEHVILLETFVSSALAAERAVKALNSLIENDGVEFELVVLPPAEGGLKQYIGVIVKAATSLPAVVASLVLILDSESIDRISTEAFGRGPTDAIIEVIRNYKDKTREELETDIGNLIPPLGEEQNCRVVEQLLSEAAERSLSLPTYEINRLSLPSSIGFELASAQSDLFTAAAHDSRVMGIGFNEEDHFPIPRSEFPGRAVRPSPPPVAEDAIEWRVSLETILVTSPNFDRSDSRKWKGKLVNGSTCLFDIEDEHFWHESRVKGVDFTQNTTIGVQLASRYVEGRVRERKVLRILTIDSHHFANPLDDSALQAMLGKFTHQIQMPEQTSLFD